jgi:hypothetical protein
MVLDIILAVSVERVPDDHLDEVGDNVAVLCSWHLGAPEDRPPRRWPSPILLR